MEKTNKSLTKHHLQNRPGKFLSIAFIYTSHTCGKNFFSEFPNFLPKMLMKKKKKFTNNQLFSRYCWNSTEYCAHFSRMASLKIDLINSFPYFVYSDDSLITYIFALFLLLSQKRIHYMAQTQVFINLWIDSVIWSGW